MDAKRLARIRTHEGYYKTYCALRVAMVVQPPAWYRVPMHQPLSEMLLELTSIDSFIGEEKALCDHLQARFARTAPRHNVVRHKDSLIVTFPRPGKRRIGLIGHLDVVRAHHDAPPRIEGERLYGPGAADMKSGLAVMIGLIERLDLEKLPVELTFVFYEREEGPYNENRLGELLDNFESLRTLDYAIALEPSDNKLSLGCMGSLQASVIFHGRTAHSARPWQGDNAFYKAIPFLQELEQRGPIEVVIDGLTYREVITPTLVKGGRSRNIVPDAIEFNVNYRFRPGKTPEQALDELRAIASPAEVHQVDGSPSALPYGEHPFTQRLIASGVAAVEAKQAWTDVGRFGLLGVPAVNFGPGTNAQAHQRNEYTDLKLLDEGYEILHRFVNSLPNP